MIRSFMHFILDNAQQKLLDFPWIKAYLRKNDKLLMEQKPVALPIGITA